MVGHAITFFRLYKPMTQDLFAQQLHTFFHVMETRRSMERDPSKAIRVIRV